jgi:hypothetical protein
MAGTHIIEISDPRGKSQFIKRISLEFSSEKLKYYGLSSTDLNSNDWVTYCGKLNLKMRLREIRLNP